MMDKIKNNPIIAITAAILLGVLSLKLLVEHSKQKISSAETARAQAALAIMAKQQLPPAVAPVAKNNVARTAAPAPAKPAGQPLKSTLAASNRLLAASAPKLAARPAKTVKLEPLRQATGYTALPPKGVPVPSNTNRPVGASFDSSHDMNARQVANFEKELSIKVPAKTLKTIKKKTYAAKSLVKN
jgi:hypothetical protein